MDSQLSPSDDFQKFFQGAIATCKLKLFWLDLILNNKVDHVVDRYNLEWLLVHVKAKIKKETNDDRPLDKITVRAFCNNNWVRINFTS